MVNLFSRDALASVEWEVDDARISFAKRNRDAFVSTDQRLAS
jgi:hypothetical protein